jgi:GH15 family glucan-1,4-alpha-glucosidase
VQDFMPIASSSDHPPHSLIRRVICVRGRVEFETEIEPRFDYGRQQHDVQPHPRGAIFQAPSLSLALASPRPLKLTDASASATFALGQGQSATFALVPAKRGEEPPAFDEHVAGVAFEDAVRYWRGWLRQSRYTGRWREMVHRSALTLKLLTYRPTGAIVAAPTTSLPEDFGGERNWDYRFCWLRDASLTLEALLASGYVDEARLWRNWLVRAVAGDPEDLQIMYAVDGARRLPERTLDHLPGYADSTPVRVGNGAVEQRQSDVLGEVMIALDEARRRGLEVLPQAWAMQRALVDELARHWDAPDNGLWEIRGPRRHFTHSRVMVWAALDRAVRGVEEWGLEGPVERWRDLRERVRAEVLEKGYDAERGTFTQHYDTREVDASLLLIPLVGFLPADDPRVLGTIAAVEHDLMRDGFLLRYRTQSGVDGLAGDEHPFLACSWWLVSAYAVSGQVDKATALMDRLVTLFNDVGLVSEEYDPANRRLVGNFPQAFSHLAFIGAAHALAAATRTSGSGAPSDPVTPEPAGGAPGARDGADT